MSSYLKTVIEITEDDKNLIIMHQSLVKSGSKGIDSAKSASLTSKEELDSIAEDIKTRQSCARKLNEEYLKTFKRKRKASKPPFHPDFMFKSAPGRISEHSKELIKKRISRLNQLANDDFQENILNSSDQNWNPADTV
ncbi:hypothetical protein DSO57_1029046 [Entomophthora muscae]|uniref:Uncharacterized protein n=1 Tax=Entomophthora muscae TaxID=34485 RepID=A0ACC2SDX3_9FUNG|nr:hypothetical protein DSO57_1029046 [Entomophthora muscae]